QHSELSLKTNADNLNPRNLHAAVLRKVESPTQAAACVRATRLVDPLDSWSKREEAILCGKTPEQAEILESPSQQRVSTQLWLDLAFDYVASGFWSEAKDLLSQNVSVSAQSAYPIVLYLLGYCAEKQGNHSESVAYWADAAKASPDYCFPARIEEMIVLQAALAANPLDSRAHYYLGNLFYDKKRYEEAIREWESSVNLDSSFAIPWRNLGIAYFNIRKDASKALSAYNNAFKTDPSDARLLYEADQLRKRTGMCASQRLTLLEAHRDLVSERDDL